MTIAHKAKLWGIAVRAYAYPASIVPVLLGNVYAWYVTGRFHWGWFALSLVAGMLYHTGCNLLNDYYDYKHGVDREGTYGGSGVLVSRQMSPREILIGAYTCLAFGTLIGLYFVWLIGWPILVIGAAGLLGAIFYTTTPLSAKYNALGEPLVFLMMGVGMVLGGYVVQTHSLAWAPIWLSLPVAFLVAAILQANDTRDIADDRESGITTAAIILGPTGARLFLSFLLFAPYLAVVVLVLTRIVPWPVLGTWLTLPLTAKIHHWYWQMRAEKAEALKGSVETTAQLHMLFGLLLSGGIIIAAWLING